MTQPMEVKALQRALQGIGTELPEFLDLLERCEGEKPQADDVKALQKWLEKIPELWRLFGDMAEIAATTTIQGINASPMVIESVKAGRLAMRNELGLGDASPLEKMLIDHTVLCWLRLQMVEYRYSDVMNQSVTLTVGDFWERRLSAAQRRYLRACESLARIRRLRLPAMQVNIAEKQVNIAGGKAGE